MLIVGIENPAGETHYLACAFPSACGKTNLAMLIPPATMPGWKVWTVGEDIAWLHPGSDGRLRAINPEAGFFGVVPGTNAKTNKNAYEMIHHDTIYTNVAVTADGQPWWEGLTEGTPVYDWQGRPYDKANGPAAHPNARFTVSARQNPSYSTRTEDPEGVPISAILFGGRRREVAPLVYEARDWRHGVLVGAGMASETTAAAIGQVGVVRRDPMAMKPFCGYNFADYWAHWLSFESRLTSPPRVFHVNWFRQDRNGKFLWPGYGDNLRVLGVDHRPLHRQAAGGGNADRFRAARGRSQPAGSHDRRRHDRPAARRRPRRRGTPRSTTSAVISTNSAGACPASCATSTVWSSARSAEKRRAPVSPRADRRSRPAPSAPANARARSFRVLRASRNRGAQTIHDPVRS